jgi:hypothetical protein
MSAPYLTVANLTRLIEDRDCFPAIITDDELHQLIRAVNKLVSRAEQELVNRLTAQLWAEQKPAKP